MESATEILSGWLIQVFRNAGLHNRDVGWLIHIFRNGLHDRDVVGAVNLDL